MDVARRQPGGHPCHRLRALRGQRRQPQGQLAIRAAGRPGALRHLCLHTADRRRHGLCRGSAQQRVRPRPRERQGALGPALRRHQRRAERASPRRRARLRSDGLRCVRALGNDRPRALAPPSDERHPAVRRRRPGHLEGPRVPRHDRVRPARARRDLRAGRAHRGRSLAVRHGQESMAPPLAVRRRGHLVPGVGRRAGAAVRGNLQSPAVGRDPEMAQRHRVSRAGPLHRFAGRARRPHRPAPVARPGDSPRHPRLRLRGDTDPRDGRRLPPGVRRGQGRSRDRLESRHAAARLEHHGRAAPTTTWGRCREPG